MYTYIYIYTHVLRDDGEHLRTESDRCLICATPPHVYLPRMHVKPNSPPPYIYIYIYI